MYMEGEKPILAKGGLKTPTGMDQGQEVEWIVESFRDRTTETTYELEVPHSLREIWKENRDWTKEAVTRHLRMDFDWKRTPLSVVSREIRGSQHIAFDTQPWKTTEQFLNCRKQWEQFAKSSDRCLQTQNDFDSFTAYMDAAVAKNMNRSLKGGTIKMALRMFLRALVRSEWGLDRGDMTNAEIASWLSAGSYPTTCNDLKNAKQQPLFTHQIPRTSEIEQFVGYVKNRFPSFRAEELVVTDSEEPARCPKPGQKSDFDKVVMKWYADTRQRLVNAGVLLPFGIHNRFRTPGPQMKQVVLAQWLIRTGRLKKR